jgi:hypothetical protein
MEIIIYNKIIIGNNKQMKMGQNNEQKSEQEVLLRTKQNIIEIIAMME